MAASRERSDERDLEWLSLDDGEEIVWTDGPDRRTLIPAFAIGIPLSIVLIGVFIIVGEYLRVTNTHYVVTDNAVYKKTGILSRDVKRIEHEKVQDISYSQSALGAFFGYGTVELTTAGGSGVEMAFKAVLDPRTVQQRISEQLKRHRSPSETGANDDVLEEILAELRAIRSAVDAHDSGGVAETPDSDVTDASGSDGAEGIRSVPEGSSIPGAPADSDPVRDDGRDGSRDPNATRDEVQAPPGDGDGSRR
ncbi:MULTISPECIES: PH domain-containing protein [Natrialbaceae]|uniref:PH domain-containing protein n=1 Tax=Natrialbaceae TaxID=1644061 RepID=UPI00207CE499|nr:PH domain-containing protein [Natronococcus sp. CG52]